MAARGWVVFLACAAGVAAAALGCSAVLGIGDLPGASEESVDATPADRLPGDVSTDAVEEAVEATAFSDAGRDGARDGDGGDGGPAADSDAAGDAPSEGDAPSVVVGPPVVIGVTEAITSAVAITPAGAAAGDQLFFALGAYEQTTVTLAPPTSGGVPAALVQRVNHASGGNDSILSAVYSLTLLTAPEPTYTFGVSGGNGNAIDVVTLCVRGGSAVDTGTGNDGYDDQPTATGLTTAGPDELLVWYWYGDDHAIVTPPAGFTAQLDGTGAPGNLSGGYYGEYTGVAAEAGATGDVAASASGADDWVVLMLAVEPAGS